MGEQLAAMYGRLARAFVSTGQGLGIGADRDLRNTPLIQGTPREASDDQMVVRSVSGNSGGASSTGHVHGRSRLMYRRFSADAHVSRAHYSIVMNGGLRIQPHRRPTVTARGCFRLTRPFEKQFSGKTGDRRSCCNLSSSFGPRIPSQRFSGDRPNDLRNNNLLPAFAPGWGAAAEGVGASCIRATRSQKEED